MDLKNASNSCVFAYRMFADLAPAPAVAVLDRYAISRFEVNNFGLQNNTICFTAYFLPETEDSQRDDFTLAGWKVEILAARFVLPVPSQNAFYGDISYTARQLHSMEGVYTTQHPILTTTQHPILTLSVSEVEFALTVLALHLRYNPENNLEIIIDARIDLQLKRHRERLILCAKAPFDQVKRRNKLTYDRCRIVNYAKIRIVREIVPPEYQWSWNRSLLGVTPSNFCFVAMYTVVEY